MIRIAVVGDIGSGKSYVAKLFGYPVFNADAEVARLYRKSRRCYNNLKKELPNYVKSFPVKKGKLSEAIINATSLGLKKDDHIKLNYKAIGKDKIFYDLIFNPDKTNFLLEGEGLGNETTNGKMMFICQAQLAFKIWHNILPKIDNETIKLLES